MDVLENYTTYSRFYGLIKQIENDPDVPRKKAAKELSRYMNLHPHNIKQVVSIVIDHFRTHVMHELGGKAKAMVVTGSRLEAVRYKLAFDEYIRAKGYTGIKSLVAFSGTVDDPDRPDEPFTEVGLNDGLSEKELPETFGGDIYKVLIVAEKYQTGFDQPLLQTMYVVKKLAGVQAVQTLSRLNRRAEGKTRTFVLDFVNKEEDIYEAFKPYYEATPVGENAEPQQLNDLQHKLYSWAIFSPQIVSDFAAVWYGKRRDHTGGDHRKMNAILDPCVEAFKERPEDEREEFRGQLTAFRNLYSFLSQIIPYQDSDLEKLFTFVRNLGAKLPKVDDKSAFALDDDVALKYFRVQQMSNGSIDLSDGEADPLKGPTDVGTAARKDEEVSLSLLVDKLNERFGTDFSKVDELFFDQIEATAGQDGKIIEAVHANEYANFEAFFARVLDDLVINRMDGNEEIASRVMTDDAFRELAQKHLARKVYDSVRKGREH
jgi:type I restriction enzyme R subunit